MDAKLFFSTFLLIFLAELGDKTQLAAMARTASSDGAKWTVFFAASAALVVSTLVAVLFGHVLTKFIPEHVIKMAAGTLFILFGGLILYDTLRRPAPEPAEAMPAAVARPGMLARAVLRIAADFEQASADDYLALAAKAATPAGRAMLLTLAAEEREHLRMLRETTAEHAEVVLTAVSPELLPGEPELKHDVAASADPALAHAVAHEEATARFYFELARLTPLPSLKHTFTTLARAEQGHAERLKRTPGVI